MQTLVLSYNKSRLTEKCIRSLLRFLHESNITLIHNGSSEQDVRYLENTFPNIEHLKIENNGGFSGGANYGLNHVLKNNSWAFFVTNDCELASPPIEPPQPGIYAPLIFRRRLEHVDSLGGYFNPHLGKLRHNRQTSKFNKQIPFHYFYIPGTAFLVDQQTWQKMGGFDESLHTYWEDVDLSARAHKLGLHLGTIAEVKLIHQVGKTCHKKEFYTKHLFHRNRKIVSIRHAHPLLQPVLKHLL